MDEEQKTILRGLIWDAIDRHTIGSKKGMTYNGVLAGNLVDRLLCVIRDNHTPVLPKTIWAIKLDNPNGDGDFIHSLHYDGGEADRIMWNELGGKQAGYYLQEMQIE